MRQNLIIRFKIFIFLKIKTSKLKGEKWPEKIYLMLVSIYSSQDDILLLMAYLQTIFTLGWFCASHQP